MNDTLTDIERIAALVEQDRETARQLHAQFPGILRELVEAPDQQTTQRATARLKDMCDQYGVFMRHLLYLHALRRAQSQHASGSIFDVPGQNSAIP